MPPVVRRFLHVPRILRVRHTYGTLATLLAGYAAGCSAPPEPIPVDDDDSSVPAFTGMLPAPAPAAPGVPAPVTTPSASAAPEGAGVAPSSPPEQNPASGAPVDGANGNSSDNGGNDGAGGAEMAAGSNSDTGVGGSSMASGGSAGMESAAPQDPGLPQQPPADPVPVDQAPVEPVTPPDQAPVDQAPVDTAPPDQAPVDPAPPDPAPIDPVPAPPSQPPAAPDIPCPADATFCSGFEGAGLPDGSTFVIGGDSSFGDQFAIDTTVSRSGQQSFSIPGPSPGFSYRALTVPAPGQDFWARLYVQVGTEFGDDNHDALFGASNGDQQSDHNNETLIELSEQFGYMLLNTDDCALECNTPSPQLQLAPGVWHCLEAHYDAANQHVEVFLEGERFIDSVRPEYAFTYQTFRLGYMRFNTERAVHYDDVVVARSQVGCD